ncbi:MULTISPECIES: hypothetical protein [unclassified Carboxylicivirga]|uniref:hypothetical protein n=1 Tax=Carboxylicivirga TaxID=1628153 RepID=UPI003D33A951
MTHKLRLLIILFSIQTLVLSQENTPFKAHGELEGRLFLNFNADIVGDEHDKAFELKRAYLGYRYQITPQWRAHLRVDVGGSEFVIEDAQGQYVFFKTAAVYYEQDQWFAAFGLHDTYQFKPQERLWGKRYILPSMLDRQKFDFSADIGASGSYRGNNFTIDMALFNGEGYKQWQADDAFRGSLGVTSWLIDRKIIARLYTDYSTASVPLASITGFIGFDLKTFTLGAEYTFQNNYGYFDGHDRAAYSLFTQYNVTKRFGLWARIDGMNSTFNMGNAFDGDEAEHIAHWQERDGEDIFAGVEYHVVPKHIKASLNYQHHRTNQATPVNSGKLFFNVEVSF